VCKSVLAVLCAASLMLSGCRSDPPAEPANEKLAELLDRATRLQEAGRPLQAAAQLGAAAHYAPDNPTVRHRLAEFYQSRKLWDAAEAEYRNALSFETSAGTWVGLADLLRNRNRLPEAIRAYRSALALSPRSPRAGFGLCLAQVRNESFTAAVADCELGARLNPQDVATRRRLGLALLRLERYQDAAGILLEGTAFTPEQRAEILRTLPPGKAE
jgi:tetratricopeptide (TPR) repeat protein